MAGQHNRLLELQQYGSFAPLSEQLPGDGSVSIEIPEGFAFEKDIAEIKEGMSSIRKNFKLIKEAFNKQLWSTSTVETGGAHGGHGHGHLAEQRQGEEIEELLANTNSIANMIRTKLKYLKTLQETLPPEDAGKRMLHNAHGPLTQKFLDLMTEYQTLQTDYKDKFRARVYRQAEIVIPGVSAQEVDQMIASGDSERLFADRILNDHRHAEARNALMLMQEQQRDLMNLERSIAELNSLFLDVTTMMDSQGDTLSAIARTTTGITVKTSRARQNIEKAEKLVRKRRRRCIIIIASIVGVVLVILAITLAPLAAAA